jgi:hypothetical protein
MPLRRPRCTVAAEDEAMYRSFGFYRRRAGMEMQAFIDHYETVHVPLVTRLAGAPPVYKRRYLLRGGGSDQAVPGLAFDVMTEVGFADKAGFKAWMAKLSAPGVGEVIAADEARFLDRSPSWAYLVEEYGA